VLVSPRLLSEVKLESDYFRTKSTQGGVILHYSTRDITNPPFLSNALSKHTIPYYTENRTTSCNKFNTAICLGVMECKVRDCICIDNARMFKYWEDAAAREGEHGGGWREHGWVLL
jgi:hypothetical protein